MYSQTVAVFKSFVPVQVVRVPRNTPPHYSESVQAKPGQNCDVYGTSQTA